jgi:NMD protein affecting ribosome stability and mRNA decay
MEGSSFPCVKCGAKINVFKAYILGKEIEGKKWSDLTIDGLKKIAFCSGCHSKHPEAKWWKDRKTSHILALEQYDPLLYHPLGP